jgi:hypothetical protein
VLHSCYICSTKKVIYDDLNAVYAPDVAFEEMPQSEKGQQAEPAEDISGKISPPKT